MAVKPEQIKARLRILFPKANLSQKRIDAIAAKLCLKPADDADDIAIDDVLNGANDFMSFEDIAKDDDRVRTLEANQKAPQTPAEIEAARVEAERVKNLNNPPAPEDAPAWAKAMAETNKKLLEKVEAMESGKVIESKRATASELFAKSEVLKNMPDSVRKNWENRIDVNSETSFEDQILGLETEYGELVQGSADTSNYAGPAGSGKSDYKYDEKEIERLVGEI